MVGTGDPDPAKADWLCIEHFNARLKKTREMADKLRGIRP